MPCLDIEELIFNIGNKALTLGILINERAEALTRIQRKNFAHISRISF